MLLSEYNLNFGDWISTIKTKIHEARRKVALSINSQLIELYWEIGRELQDKLEKAAWGSNLIEQVADELRIEFPDMKGFSRRNLFAIRQWYRFYSVHFQFVPQFVAQIPWGHNRLIITKIKDISEAEYIGKLNFYLSAVDSQLKMPEDNPSIGILLCKGKNKIEVEYSLRDVKKPMGVSEYMLNAYIPDDVKSKLPSIEQLERSLNTKHSD